MTGRNGKRGFTLLEILAGLAVTATVILSLTFGVGIATRALSRGDVDSVLAEQVGRAASRFADDVESLIPWRYAVGPDPQIVFAGDSRSITFAAIAQIGAYTGPRLRLVSYRFVPTEVGMVVQRRTAPIPADPGRPNTAEWGDPVVVIAGVDQPRFDFATQGRDGWTDTWAPTASVPTAVRLSFVIRGRSIVIDAPIYADADRDCRLPAKDLACPQAEQPPDQPDPNQPPVPEP